MTTATWEWMIVRSNREESEGVLVGRIRATDTIVSALQRWATIIIMVAGFLVGIGINVAQFQGIKETLVELKAWQKGSEERAVQQAQLLALIDLRLRAVEQTNGGNSPEMRRMQADIAELRGDLKEVVDTQFTAFNAAFTSKVADLKAKQDLYDARVAEIRADMRNRSANTTTVPKE